MSNISDDDFIAELKYRTSAEGGRLTAAGNGYRPAVKFPFSTMLTSGRQTFLDKEIVHPGETVKASIKIISVDYFANKLEEGMIFEFSEGPRIIGTGKIISVLNPKLLKT